MTSSTSITLNSLMRFDNETQTAPTFNVFDFEITAKVTSNWIFKRRAFSRAGLTKVTDAFEITVCRVFIPMAIVPVQQSMLFLQIIPGGIQLIDKQIGPMIRENNIFAGYTGPCLPPPDGLPNYNNVWTLVPSQPSNTPTHWIYESCTNVAFNTDWKGIPIHVRVRDAQGYTLVPPIPPANGITGLTGCYAVTTGFTGGTGVCPCNCDPDWAVRYLNYVPGTPLTPSIPSAYQPFFLPANQMMAVLSVKYVEFDGVGLNECYYKD